MRTFQTPHSDSLLPAESVQLAFFTLQQCTLGLAAHQNLSWPQACICEGAALKMHWKPQTAIFGVRTATALYGRWPTQHAI